MSFTSDSIGRAIRVNVSNRERAVIDATAITDPDNEHYHYYCADCVEKGHHVRLKHVRESQRRVTFEQWNKYTERRVFNSGGEPVTREKNYTLLAHFDRWPDTKEHQCEQAVRYAAFRKRALLNNALQIGPHSFIFPIALPGAGGWNEHNGEAPKDLRSSFRPAGMGLGGLRDAVAFKKLLAQFERDPGLQHFQYFHDGYKLRKFDETFFESPAALYTYLQNEQAVGRSASVVAAYLLNPNNTTRTGMDYLDGFIDRSVPVLDDGEKLKLFVRGMNRPAEKLLAETGRRPQRSHNWASAPILVFGEARIDDVDPHHVEMEFYNPRQISEWDSGMRFLPKFHQGLEGQINLAL